MRAASTAAHLASPGHAILEQGGPEQVADVVAAGIAVNRQNPVLARRHEAKLLVVALVVLLELLLQQQPQLGHQRIAGLIHVLQRHRLVGALGRYLAFGRDGGLVVGGQLINLVVGASRYQSARQGKFFHPTPPYRAMRALLGAANPNRGAMHGIGPTNASEGRSNAGSG